MSKVFRVANTLKYLWNSESIENTHRTEGTNNGLRTETEHETKYLKKKLMKIQPLRSKDEIKTQTKRYLVQSKIKIIQQ